MFCKLINYWNFIIINLARDTGSKNQYVLGLLGYLMDDLYILDWYLRAPSVFEGEWGMGKLTYLDDFAKKWDTL